MPCEPEPPPAADCFIDEPHEWHVQLGPNQVSDVEVIASAPRSNEPNEHVYFFTTQPASAVCTVDSGLVRDPLGGRTGALFWNPQEEPVEFDVSTQRIEPSCAEEVVILSSIIEPGEVEVVDVARFAAFPTAQPYAVFLQVVPNGPTTLTQARHVPDEGMITFRNHADVQARVSSFVYRLATD